MNMVSMEKEGRNNDRQQHGTSFSLNIFTSLGHGKSIKEQRTYTGNYEFSGLAPARVSSSNISPKSPVVSRITRKHKQEREVIADQVPGVSSTGTSPPIPIKTKKESRPEHCYSDFIPPNSKKGSKKLDDEYKEMKKEFQTRESNRSWHMHMDTNTRRAAILRNRRRHYRATTERISKLHKIGFVCIQKRRRPSIDTAWKKKFEELLHFRSHFGSCPIPRNFPDNPRLARWADIQRQQYRLLAKGQQSTLTKMQVQLLHEIGFAWNSEEEIADKIWKTNFNELRRYKNIFGECIVRQSFPANPALGSWVYSQRMEHRRMCRGEPSSLTAKRMSALDSIGFIWESNGKSIVNSTPGCDVFHKRNIVCEEEHKIPLRRRVSLLESDLHCHEMPHSLISTEKKIDNGPESSDSNATFQGVVISPCRDSLVP